MKIERKQGDFISIMAATFNQYFSLAWLLLSLKNLLPLNESDDGDGSVSVLFLLFVLREISLRLLSFCNGACDGGRFSLLPVAFSMFGDRLTQTRRSSSAKDIWITGKKMTRRDKNTSFSMLNQQLVRTGWSKIYINWREENGDIITWQTSVAKLMEYSQDKKLGIFWRYSLTATISISSA